MVVSLEHERSLLLAVSKFCVADISATKKDNENKRTTSDTNAYSSWKAVWESSKVKICINAQSWAYEYVDR